MANIQSVNMVFFVICVSMQHSHGREHPSAEANNHSDTKRQQSNSMKYVHWALLNCNLTTGAPVLSSFKIPDTSLIAMKGALVGFGGSVMLSPQCSEYRKSLERCQALFLEKFWVLTQGTQSW